MLTRFKVTAINTRDKSFIPNVQLTKDVPKDIIASNGPYLNPVTLPLKSYRILRSHNRTGLFPRVRNMPLRSPEELERRRPAKSRRHANAAEEVARPPAMPRKSSSILAGRAAATRDLDVWSAAKEWQNISMHTRGLAEVVKGAVRIWNCTCCKE